MKSHIDHPERAWLMWFFAKDGIAYQRSIINR